MWALFIPWLLVVVLIAGVLFLCLRRWRVSVAFLLIALIINWYGEVFTIGGLFGVDSEDKSLKVMTFNLNGSEADSLMMEGLLRLIKDEDPDVLFVAECNGICDSILTNVLVLPYPYLGYQDDVFGHYIFSKYELVKISKIEGIGFGTSILAGKIVFNEDSIQLVGCHLTSNNYDENNKYMLPEQIEDKATLQSYFHNVKRASGIRKEEAERIVEKCDGHCIVMGDFNDVSSSPCLNVFENVGFVDAWREGGFGYGATIHHPLPYRIDHIMYNDGLKLKSIKKIDAHGLSDHDALVAEFYFE